MGLVSVLALARLVVGPGGEYRTIAEALLAARPGDTIEIRAGTYREPRLLIDRPVTIVGRDQPLIQGAGDHTILEVRADGVVIEGLTLRHVRPAGTEDRAAIRLEGVRGCRVTRNRIEDAFFGIYAAKAADCLIADNRVIGPGRVEAESGNAIHLWSSQGMTVERNEVTGHRDGLYLEFVTGSRLSANSSHGNRRYGLHFMFSDSCAYDRNVFRRNGAGVAVMYTRRVTMTDNLFADNQGPTAYGLLLKDIDDSWVAGNRFDRNTVGLYLEGSNRQRVSDNRFTANGWAVRVLANALDNEFSGNSFVGNAFDVATNSRTATSRFRGNFWDRYRGFDLDGDGRGDVPHRPVRLFALIVERYEPALILLRSIFADLLDVAERLLPVLTPQLLIDEAPLLERPG
jgi:nitrous oxidase accessory protein